MRDTGSSCWKDVQEEVLVDLVHSEFGRVNLTQLSGELGPIVW